jgi:hypothetical protein
LNFLLAIDVEDLADRDAISFQPHSTRLRTTPVPGRQARNSRPLHRRQQATERNMETAFGGIAS